SVRSASARDQPRGGSMNVLVTIFLAATGLAIGSFLNVCIYRLPRHESLSFPASHCTACQRPLDWFENVPVIGWLVLRGRCRTCHAAISSMYPVVEGITGAVFVTGYAIY